MPAGRRVFCEDPNFTPPSPETAADGLPIAAWLHATLKGAREGEVSLYGLQSSAVYSNPPMIRFLGTAIGALAGLAFGGFLNLCLSRWTAGEGVSDRPGRCPHCGREPAWWEDVPLASWLLLRGRCRGCHAWIGWRYPIVELAVGSTWAIAAWQTMPALYLPGWTRISIFDALVFGAVKMLLCWLLIGLAVLDAERHWLPDWLTLGGAALGLPVTIMRLAVHWIWEWLPVHWSMDSGLAGHPAYVYDVAIRWLIGLVAAPSLFVLARRIYRQLRRREGMDLGHTKLVLLLAVWLGLSHTVLALILAVFLGAAGALVVIAARSTIKASSGWEVAKLPLGAFLCIGGIVSGLWGGPIIVAYLRWCGFVL